MPPDQPEHCMDFILGLLAVNALAVVIVISANAAFGGRSLTSNRR
jgi:hypothetical protein